MDWTEDAVVRLYELSHGYPYFIQEFGRQAWDLADEDSRTITRDDVARSVHIAIDELDSGFFQVRTGKTTDHERAYLSPRYNELAFTVPMFDEFMKRWMPEAPQ
ncbi:MAG: hypothetical protein ACYCV7_09990 [Acidimicrobiales bacterium]